jgi:hypothetical protein
MTVRDLATIVALWPLCERCRHRAPEHLRWCCQATVSGRCPACNHQHVIVRCDCIGYVGPTVAEFCARFLTPEERTYYFFDPHTYGTTR